VVHAKSQTISHVIRTNEGFICTGTTPEPDKQWVHRYPTQRGTVFY